MLRTLELRQKGQCEAYGRLFSRVPTVGFSLGPEVGFGPVGLDGGYLVEISGSGHRQGFAVRPMLTASWVSITGRVGYLTGHGAQEVFGEAGLLFEVPVAIRPTSDP